MSYTFGVDWMTARRAAPIVYGMLTAVMWIFVKGTVATVVTVVGALALGLMYVVTGPMIARSGEGRDRRRTRGGGQLG